MGSLKNKLTNDGWEEHTLTEQEVSFINTLINTKNSVVQSYDEMVGRFLGASLVPRIGKEGAMQFDLDPTDPTHKVRVRPFNNLDQTDQTHLHKD